MISEKIFVGFAAGLAAGIVVGILIAPEKGSVTIKKITDKAEDYTGDLKGIFTDGMKGVTDQLEILSGIVNDFLEKGLLVNDDSTKIDKIDGNGYYSKS